MAMTFFLAAMVEVVANTGLFNSAVYGFRSFGRIFKRTMISSEEAIDEYYEYVKSQRKFQDIPMLLAFGGGLLVLSILVALL